MNEKREEVRQRTLKTADNHRQYWTADEDQAVIDRYLFGYTPRTRQATDEELAVALGRTQLAVMQRRVVLNKLLETMTLEEIHDVERFKRTRSNEGRYGLAVANLQKLCAECYCAPHAVYCSKA